MMSMFSTVDALRAEFEGQKVRLSMGPAKEPKPKPKPNPMDREGNSTNPQHVNRPKRQPQQQQRRPTFAPELDGVHVFETIILY